MKKGFKILGLTFFFALTILIIYLAVVVEDKQGYVIGVIEIKGNIHLANDVYFKFANLDDKNAYSNLSIQVVKDRIEKHPYVRRADVLYEGDGKVSVNIFEKTFQSVLFVNDEQFLVTKNMEVLPILPFTKNLDYPVISNPVSNNSIELMKNLKGNKDVLTAYKILSTLELISPELYDNISEIDLRRGKDIVIFFSVAGYPVWIGRNNEIEKVIYFSTLWSLLRGKEINNYLDYIDLRYDNNAYLGFAAERIVDGELRS